MIFCFGFCHKGNAQLNDSIKTLEMTGVVITATKSEKPLVELTVPATIISKEEILSSGHSRLNEIINEQTGLVTVPSFGGGEGIQLQGIDSDYTLILLDGLPLIGRVAGNFDLSRITLGSVERIEIIKGASSSLYGSEALGGVVNIITNKNHKEGFQSNLSYKYGSFKTQDANTEIRYGKNDFSLSTNLNYYSSDGYDLIEGDNQKTVEAFNNFTGDISLNYNNNTLGLINIKFRTFLEKRDGTVFITSPGLSAKSNTSENNVTIRHKKQITEKTSTFLDYYRTNFNNEESNILNNVLQNNTFDQTLERIDLRFAHLLNKASLTAGIGLNNEFLERTNISTKPKLKSQFIYFQYDWILNKKLNVVSGLRYDKHNEYKSQLSPKISFKIDLSNRFNIKGSIGSGYKAPDFRQLYLNFSNSSSGYIVLGANILEQTIKSLQENEELLIYNEPENNKLNSESSNSYNLGIQYYVNSNFPLEINFFRNILIIPRTGWLVCFDQPYFRPVLLSYCLRSVAHPRPLVLTQALHDHGLLRPAQRFPARHYLRRSLRHCQHHVRIPEPAHPPHAYQTLQILQLQCHRRYQDFRQCLFPHFRLQTRHPCPEHHQRRLRRIPSAQTTPDH